MALYEEMHAAGLAQKPYGAASYLEQFSKKLHRTAVSTSLPAVISTHMNSFLTFQEEARMAVITNQLNFFSSTANPLESFARKALQPQLHSRLYSCRLKGVRLVC